MEIIKLDLDKILELEFIHDNKTEMQIFESGINFFNMIERKFIRIKEINKHPEETMKEYIFKNINYNKLKIYNTPFEEQITETDKIKLKDNIILVFDNVQLTKTNIEMFKLILKDKNIRIFIPFIYIAEQLLLNITPMRMRTKIEYFRLNNDFNCGEIIFDNYFNADNTLIENYKKEAEDIGFYYDDIDDKLINYNIFETRKDFLSSESTINTKYKRKIIYQLQILYKFLKKFNFNVDKRKRTKFDKTIIELYEQIKIHLIENEKIKENIIFNEFIKKLFEKIKAFIMSLKEARDSYYLIEIKKLKEKPEFTNYDIFYITTDEITNCRCILESISSFNVLKFLPRYIIYIDNNQIILKLFNIYHEIVHVNDKESEIYKLIQKVRGINYRESMQNTKSILTKKYNGGKYDSMPVESSINLFNKPDQKIDLFKFNDNLNYNIFNYKHINKMEPRLEFILNKDYVQIRDYICKIKEDFCNHMMVFRKEDKFILIEKIIKKDPIYIDIIDKINIFFKDLIFLYETIEPNVLLENLKIINAKYAKYDTCNSNSDNDSDTESESVSDDEIEDNAMTKAKQQYSFFTSTFTSPCMSAFKKYELFKTELKKEIPKDKWKYLYCTLLINNDIYHYPSRHEKLEYLKYLFPSLFENCPVNDFIMLFNIHFETIIRYEKDKLRENPDFVDFDN
jgi:hypothetical protein